MKKEVFVFLFLMFFGWSVNGFAQANPSFNWQLKVRDVSGIALFNRDVAILISIAPIDDIENVQFSERHEVNSGSTAQINIQVGTGVPILGALSEVDWQQERLALVYKLDPNGGNNYLITHARPFRSHPYAFQSYQTEGVYQNTMDERDSISAPAIGQMMFCSDCGVTGRFQYFNGKTWVDALGGEFKNNQVLVEQIIIDLKNSYNLDFQPDSNSVLLETTILPDSATNKGVEWSVNNPLVAEVDSNGVITILDFGNFELTASAVDGSETFTTLEFQIVEERNPNDLPTGLEVLGDTSIVLGQSAALVAQLIPFEEPDTNAVWVSENEGVLSVSDKGVVHALQLGRSTIQVSVDGNPTLFDTINIQVIKDPSTVDVEFPVIVVDGYDAVNEVFLQRFGGATIPFGVGLDNKDDSVEVSFAVYDTAFNPVTFNGDSLRTYNVIYSATDSAGNEAFDTVQFVVGDSIAPIITINSQYVSGDTIFRDNRLPFQIPEATAIDENLLTIIVNIDSNGFNSSGIGLKLVTYVAVDPNGNMQRDSLFIYTSDSTAPIITFNDNVMAGDTITFPIGTSYTFPTANALDNGPNTLPIEFFDGGIDTNKISLSRLEYAAVDSSGNKTIEYIYLETIDVTPPEILNKNALKAIVSSLNDTPTVIAQVVASDNVGIVSYSIERINTMGENYEGEIDISPTGVVFASRTDDLFEAPFAFLVTVTDAAGLTDTTILELYYTSGRIRDIRAKQFEPSDWVYIGRRDGDPVPYVDVIKEEFAVGDTMLYLTAEGNAQSSFDHIAFHPTNPGVGSTDFELISDGNVYMLSVANLLDTLRQDSYTLHFNVVTRNRIDTSVITPIPIEVHLSVASIRKLNPAISEIVDESVDIRSLTLGDILLAEANPQHLACPLSFANGIMGDLAESMEQKISLLPVISAKEAKKTAKFLISKLPAYYWLRKDGEKIRLNVKVPLKAKTIEIEYVVLPNDAGCYWVALLSELKPSKVSTRLNFLDGNTSAGVIVNTVSVTDKSFECITIPCIDLNPGGHLVAFGNPTQNVPGSIPVAAAIVNPIGFGVVSPLQQGYNHPNLTFTLGLKTTFKTAFDNAMIERLDIASQATQFAITQAKRRIDDAIRLTESATSSFINSRAEFQFIEGEITRLQGALNQQSSYIDAANIAIGAAVDAMDAALNDKQICYRPCLTPCYYPSVCGSAPFYKPCTKSCGCQLYGPEICVPNPIAEALARTIGEDKLQPAQTQLENATKEFIRVQNLLDVKNLNRNTLRDRFNAATAALESAQSAYNDVVGELDQINLDAGPLSDIANYIIDHALDKTVATGKIQFVSDVSSMENGSYTGTLSFEVQLLQLPKISVTFPEFSFNTNDLEDQLDNVADQLINRIP